MIVRMTIECVGFVKYFPCANVPYTRFITVPEPYQAGPIGTSIITDPGGLWVHARHEPFELPYRGTRV